VNRILGRTGVRLWGLFVIGALLSITIVALMIVVSVNAQYQQTLSQQRELAESVALQASDYQIKLRNDLKTLASIVPLSPQSPNSLTRLLYSVQENNKAFMDLAIVGPDGTDRARVTSAAVSNTGLLNRSDSAAFKAALRGEGYAGPVVMENGFPVQTLSLPIINESGPVGAVLAKIDLTTMWEIVSDVELGKRGYAYLVDTSGQPIVLQDMTQLATVSSTSPVVQDAVGMKTEPTAAKSYPAGLLTPGETVLAFYKPFEAGPFTWYSIVEQPTSDAFAQINSMILAGVLLTLTSAAAIVFTGLYISRRVMRPIATLRQGAAQLAAGKFDSRIKGVKTGDELEFLADEFNDLASKLQVAQTSTTEAVREREEQYQSVQRRVREMSSLLKAGRAITSLDLENVLDNLARESAGTAGADRCAIYVLDGARRSLVLRGWWDFEGLPRPTLQYEMGEGVVGWTARENKSLFLANAQADQRYVTKWEHDQDVAAVMNLPLVDEGNVVGVLQVSTRPGTPAFTREEQRLLASFADQSAVAIKNAQLYEVERRRAQEMALVAEINRTISLSLDLDTTLNSILASIRALIPYDLGEINLWDADDQVLRTHGRDALPQYESIARAASRVYRLDEGITGWLARERKPLLAKDLAGGDVRPKMDPQDFPARSACAVPLVASDQFVGTIELASLAPEAFSDSHLETLQTVAAQSAVAIQNAQLFAETRRRVDESATLFRISTIASSALPTDELLQRLMAEIGKLVNADLGLAMIYNPGANALEPLLAASFGELPDSAQDFRITGTDADFDFSVFRQRAVFRCDDALNDNRVVPCYRPFIERYQVRSLMAAPLVVRDRGIGEMYVAKRVIDPFTDADQQRLSTVVTLLAEALENFRLSAEQQHRIRQLSALGDTGRAISAALHEEEVLDVLYEQLNHLVDAHSMFVAYYDQDQDEITFRRVYEEGQLFEAREKRRGQNSLTFYVCRQRQTLLLRGDITAEAAKLGIEVLNIASSRQAVAWMGAPMVTGERVLGCIVVQHMQNEFAFDENDLNLLQAVASQTGIALANARLYQLTDVQLSERVEELTALSAISQELNATLEPERIFAVVLTEGLQVTGADYGFISMINVDSGRLEVRATQGLTPAEARQLTAITIPLGEGITGRAAESGEPVLANDIAQSPDYVELRPGIQSEISVPIQYAQSVVGVINLESQQVNAFTSEHVNFLKALAAQAAIAIGNAQRLEEYRERGELLRRRAEQLTNLFQIGQAFRGEQTLDEILDDVVHAIQETVGFDVAVLNLLEGEPPRTRTVAAAGIPISQFEEMKKAQLPWSQYDQVLQDRFRISQSYYVPMESHEVTDQLGAVYAPGADPTEPRRPGYWHPDDYLLTLLRGTGDRVLGYISVDNPTDGRVPRRTTIETLELFANQAAIAIENSRLFADLQQRLNNLTLFNEVGRSISAKLDVEALLGTVLDAACELMSSDHATIFLRDPAADGKFVPVKTVGYDLSAISQLQFGPNEGLVGQVIADPRALIIPDVEADPRYVPSESTVLMRSMILVPLAVAGQLIGVLTSDKPTPNSYTDTDLVVLSTLADQAAVAIDNARLFEAERDQRALAETLRDLSAGLSRTLNVSDVLDRMLTEVGRVVPHDAANIMLIENGGQAHVVRSRGYDRIEPGLSTAVMNLRFAVRDTAHLRQTSDTSRPLIVNETRSYAGWVETSQTAWVRSFLCAPLLMRNQVIGFFNLDSAEPGFFTNAHAERLMAFATQAAVAIENARLYEETRRRLQDQSLLYEAGQAISSSLEFSQVLETMSQQLVRATNAQIILIQLWDRATDQINTIYQKIQTLEGLNDLGVLEKPFAPTDYLKVAQYLRDRRNISLRLNDDDLDPLLRARMQETGLLWTVEVPIVSRDEVLGLVRLGDTRFDRTLTDSEVQVIETLINQAAVAMSNARLYDQVFKFTQELEGRVAERTRELARANEDLKLERDQVETLFRIASELSTSLDLDRVLNRALELVVVAAGAMHGSILLVDPQTDVLVARAVLGGDRIPSMGKPTPFRRGEGLAGWAIVNRQSAIIPDVHADGRWVEHDERVRKYRSALVVPLSVSDDVLGAMLLLHNNANYFTDYHLRMVSAASSQVATAINNAELYRYIREQAELLGGMLRAQQVESSKSQAILESVTDGVMVSDGSGRVILFNAAAERILDIKRDEAVGRPIDDMLGLYSALGGRWQQQVREWHASAEARRRTPVLSQRLDLKAEKRYITVTVAPVTMSDEYLGSVSVFRDITAEVEADRAKTEFISTVSHELRTPMTSIKGYADLLLIGAAGAVNENQQRFLSVIKSNADRLSVLVNDLLDISRIESGRVKLELKPITVEPLLEAVVTSLHSRFEEKQLTVHVRVPEGEMPRVLADRDRVTQILTNLVSNAYQYTPPGGTVTVSAHDEGEFVQIDVTDTGIGIAPDNQSKVFERFYRVDDPNVNEFPGTGLGLAIVKSLVEMHEGRIWLQSEVGQGTTFSVALRAVRETAPAVTTPPRPTAAMPEVKETKEAAEPPAEREPVPALNGNHRRVLVVEDDKDIAELIGRHLASHGYDVSIAGRAADALEKARAHKPSLITLDIYLPDADGFELLQQLKDDPETNDIPVVIVSVMGDQREGLRLGAVDYLTKPIDPLRLVSAVNRVLHGPGKVLVVDDDRDTRDLLQTALEQRGFSVVLTSSGKRALTLARQEHPDLILLDLKLPGMDGYEVLQRLKSIPETADIPVVIITGSLTDEELKQQKLLSLGAARFMTKPFAVDELVYEIGVLVTNRALVEPVNQS
jgi:PAS domain S-box-containing protein